MTSPTLANDTFLRALRREPTDYTPVWLMRQAGRYLPEYNVTRAQAGNFIALMKDPERATEVTLQPLHRYPLDAAILFSDILTVADAMGLGLSFVVGEGPCFAHPVRTEADVARLAVPAIEEKLSYVTQTISHIRRALTNANNQQRVPLIGFAGSPWTVACYMVEGGKSADFRTIKSMLYARPDLLHQILEVNARATAAYLKAQIAAGVQTVMIFDTWGGVLAEGAFQRFSLAYITRIVQQLRSELGTAMVPVIAFTKGGGLWLEDIAASGVDAVGLDWTINLGQAHQRIGSRVALQGNLDPAVLFAPAETIRAEVRARLDEFGNHPGHVFNLGHGISQFTPPENVAEMVDEVHGYSRLLRNR